LNDWADKVRVGAQRAMRSRHTNREYTDAQFLVLSMVTVLQRDLGVKYNPACMTGPYDARDSRNHFIHGPLYGHGGTCSSLPILYAAIGRRLGYPLCVVNAKQHLFVRWEEAGGERFNFDATTRGFKAFDDAHYRQWPFPIREDKLREGVYLQSFTRRRELACCIAQRAA
jgi:hypothetical protein